MQQIQQRSFVRRMVAGTYKYNHLFSDVVCLMDISFKKFLDRGISGISFGDSPREYFLFEVAENTDIKVSDSMIIKEFDITEFTTLSELRANLEFLNQDGRYLLDIPPGKDEMDFILGFCVNGKNGNQSVLTVNHKKVNNKDVIHFHYNLLDEHSYKNLKGFAKKSRIN